MANLALIAECGVRTEKNCPHCNTIKPLSEFYKKAHHGKPGGVESWCKPCALKKDHAKHVQNPDIARSRNLKIKYGITLDQAKAILAEQGGVCGNMNCSQELSFLVSKEKREKAHVDHDHKTGRVRGILCQTCNTSLGHLENAKRVAGLMQYLNNSNKVGC